MTLLCKILGHKWRVWPYDPNAYPGEQCKRCGMLNGEVERGR